jgi:hypothetical protein
MTSKDDHFADDSKGRAKMNRVLGLLATTVLSLTALTTHPGPAPKSNAGFEKLKTLVGTWQSTSPDGGTMTSTIRLVSNGTAIEETFQNSMDNQMVTLYTPDGDRLVMTHYCSSGNQPRMETPAITNDAAKFDFSFIGVTNLSSPDAPHVHHLEIQIADSNHFSEDWTWQQDGKDVVHTMQFVRKQ